MHEARKVLVMYVRICLIELRINIEQDLYSLQLP